MMEKLVTRALIKSWSNTPIPHLNLSAGGLLALADLQTVARRTALTGGSSWLDALVLAPGLHYQQACDSLDHEDGPAWLGDLSAVDVGGAHVRHAIRNIVTLNYLKKLRREGLVDDVTIDIGMLSGDGVWKTVQKLLRRGRKKLDDDDLFPDVDWLSHALYIMSPLFTLTAMTFAILLTDWWALSFIIALMLSRILNIWAIKHRSEVIITPFPPPADRHTEYTVEVSPGRRVRLRGLDADLQALTTQGWLRAKSNLDSYLEACAKLTVYLVAALSGNLTQAGAIVLICLLLVSAALLGLSNAHARGFQMHGRYAVPKVEKGVKEVDEKTGTSTAVQSALERGEHARERIVSEGISHGR